MTFPIYSAIFATALSLSLTGFQALQQKPIQDRVPATIYVEKPVMKFFPEPYEKRVPVFIRGETIVEKCRAPEKTKAALPKSICRRGQKEWYFNKQKKRRMYRLKKTC